MAYATEQDLIDRAGEQEISQVADRDGTSETYAAAIGKALAQADARIDAALAIRFILPLSTVPDVVNQWAVSIARYFLHRDGAPDHVRKDYELALADLKLAADGRISVPGASGILPATGGDSGRIAVVSSEPQFSRENLEGWS